MSYRRKALRIHVTPSQRETLRFIRAYWHKHRRGPSQDEIAAHFGIGQPSVSARLLTLARMKLVSFPHHQARSVRVLVPSQHLVVYPKKNRGVCGTVPAPVNHTGSGVDCADRPTVCQGVPVENPELAPPFSPPGVSSLCLGRR